MFDHQWDSMKELARRVLPKRLPTFWASHCRCRFHRRAHMCKLRTSSMQDAKTPRSLSTIKAGTVAFIRNIRIIACMSQTCCRNWMALKTISKMALIKGSFWSLKMKLGIFDWKSQGGQQWHHFSTKLGAASPPSTSSCWCTGIRASLNKEDGLWPPTWLS